MKALSTVTMPLAEYDHLKARLRQLEERQKETEPARITIESAARDESRQTSDFLSELNALTKDVPLPGSPDLLTCVRWMRDRLVVLEDENAKERALKRAVDHLVTRAENIDAEIGRLILKMPNCSCLTRQVGGGWKLRLPPDNREFGTYVNLLDALRMGGLDP